MVELFSEQYFLQNQQKKFVVPSLLQLASRLHLSKFNFQQFIILQKQPLLQNINQIQFNFQKVKLKFH
ncbi:hypothetical protein TTHERM_01498870 (macronuclear) [Tetrahymena thermophila SB210]|uniref:Uncharacterized protein n=1 Tax=Tetrahymena thermophila (strain SB210) TaxID=312017 RepID=Q228U1_TETTS|nr:hypothetical protein TTHERM_01498870 [Tetrahymena thermophila SB210]EAR81808.1 hypothetical protein TTHERM_01498870 [Tetrahymena thermophila SB210]|eukprot:XP_001029471.1 hypothetical protein TTHERM_01498870 [Tetrahymena thermophila SB210]